jgi:fructosamine-3-kinase
MTPADRISRLTGSAVTGLRELGGQHGVRHYRGFLATHREFFAKFSVRSIPGVFRSEADALHWLANPAAVPLPEVFGCDENVLVLSWVPPQAPAAAAAQRFGADLARLHAAGAQCFGAARPGYLAGLPLDNEPAYGPDAWPQWYTNRRLLPFLRRAADAGALSRADIAPVEAVISRIGELAGPAEPPSRIHGDCWSGNVLWSGGRGWLIDPAAHGGHRETDLAMLALFGAPYLDHILGAYTDTCPLAGGWRARVPLHQLHPLLVHCCLFGAGYAAATRDAARAALAAS